MSASTAPAASGSRPGSPSSSRSATRFERPASRRSASASCIRSRTASTSGSSASGSPSTCPRWPFAVVRGRAGDSRVRAHLDDRRERLRAAGRRAVYDDTRAAARRGRLRREPVPDAVERRYHDARDRDALPDPARRVRPGGGRAGGGVPRRGDRQARPRVVRHGRHHGEDVPDQGRRAGDVELFEIARVHRFKRGSGLPVRCAPST